jgi:hypothetical protein
LTDIPEIVLLDDDKKEPDNFSRFLTRGRLCPDGSRRSRAEVYGKLHSPVVPLFDLYSMIHYDNK